MERPHPHQMLPELRDEGLREDGDSIIEVFTFSYENMPGRKIDIFRPQSQAFD